MPGLMDEIYRQRSGGVNVYSPTRRVVRPTGRTANAGTAQRVMQQAAVPGDSGSMFRIPGVPMSLPGFEAPTGSGGSTGSDWLDQHLGAPTGGAAQEEPGGWRGALGAVVNSLPGQAVMGALNVLDIPRRTIVSTVQEVADAFNGGDASWSDWTEQVGDPSFGFGDVVGSTGNIWADRFIGFAGDVLLDPLTYVAGAGVFSGTGRSTRMRLAGLAHAEGMSDEVIESIGRYGLSRVDNSVRERLRQAATLTGESLGEPILDRGYYLKVPFRDTFQPIPGTARLDEAVSRPFANARAWLADSRLGTTLRQRLRSPEVVATATEKLVTGRGDMSFGDAAGIYLYVNADRRIGRTATSRFNAESTRLTSEVGAKNLNGMINIAETVGGTRLNEIFNRAAKMMTDAGIAWNPRKNYIPHIVTQPAMDWLRGASKLATEFRKALIPGLDIDDMSPRLMERHLLPNIEVEIMGRKFNTGAGTIKAINDEFARVFPENKFKLFDDEISTIFAAYGNHLGDDIGRVGALKTLLASKGRLVRQRDDMLTDVVNEEATRLLNKEAADMMRNDMRAMSDRITALREAALKDTMGLQGVVGVHVRETLDEVTGLDDDLKRELDELMLIETQLSHDAGRTSAMTGLPPPSNLGNLEVKLQNAYNILDGKAAAADRRIASLHQAAAAEMLTWNSLKKMAAVDDGMMALPERFRALREWNMAVAEAASLAMDREALQEIRTQVAEAIRKVDLLEQMAEDPAYAGMRAGVATPREEWHASQDIYRTEQQIDADGRLHEVQVPEVRGPAAGPRGGKPIRAPTGRVIPWDPDQTTDAVISRATAARDKVLRDADADARVTRLNEDVVDQQIKLTNAQRKLDEAAENHRPIIEERQEALRLEINYDQNLTMRINEVEGYPAHWESMQSLKRQRNVHRDGPLHVAQQEYANAQKPVQRALDARNQAKQKLAELKRALAEGPLTPDDVKRKLARINADEHTALQRVRASGEPVRYEWASFPQQQIDAPVRRNVYTPEQRARLSELYEIVNNTHPVDRSGGNSAQLVRQARKTIKTVHGRGGPRGPKDGEALREAYRVLNTVKGTDAHHRYRAARKEINRIEAEVKAGPQGATFAQQEFADILKINDMLDDLAQTRTPLPRPKRKTAEYRAVVQSPRPPGGDPSITGRAKANLELANRAIKDYGQELIDAKAIRPEHLEYTQRLADEVNTLLSQYGRNPQPYVQSALTQASTDLGRIADVFASTRLALAANMEPTPQLMTAIAAHRILRERTTLDEHIGSLEDWLTVSSAQYREDSFNTALLARERKIADEEAIIADPDISDLDRSRAVNRRNAARRALQAQKAAGSDVVPSNFAGIVEDELDNMTQMVTDSVEEFFATRSDWWQARDWRDDYNTPLIRKTNLENNVDRYAGVIAVREAGNRRLKQAVTKAKNAGSNEVRYSPWDWRRHNNVSIEETKRRLAEGEVPEAWVSTVRTRLAQAEATLAAGNFKKVPTVSWSVQEKVGSPITLTMEEAESELAKFAGNLEQWRATVLKNQYELDAMTGAGQRRVATIEALLGDLEAPPNVEKLNDEIRKINDTIRGRPGRQPTVDEVEQIKMYEARIEQALAPPDEIRIQALADELEQRKGIIDAHEVNMLYDQRLMSTIEDNGQRMMRELATQMRAPTKDEARMIRQLMGPEGGELHMQVLRTLDDFLGDQASITDETMQQAMDILREIYGSRRPGDDALDRIIPREEQGRVLSFAETIEAAQVSTEVAMITRGGGAGTGLTPGSARQANVTADGFREDLAQTFIAQAENAYKQRVRELKALFRVLDIDIEPGVELGGVINRRFGGKIKDYSKKQKTAMRLRGEVILSVRDRQKKQIRETIAEALKNQGYDPEVSLTRRLGELKARRSRLNVYLRGLGMVLEDSGINDVGRFSEWWDNAARATSSNAELPRELAEGMSTLRVPRDIEEVATEHYGAVYDRMLAARAAGDEAEASRLEAEVTELIGGPVAGMPPAEVRPAIAAAAKNLNPADELNKVNARIDDVEARLDQLNDIEMSREFQPDELDEYNGLMQDREELLDREEELGRIVSPPGMTPPPAAPVPGPSELATEAPDPQVLLAHQAELEAIHAERSRVETRIGSIREQIAVIERSQVGAPTAGSSVSLGQLEQMANEANALAPAGLISRAEARLRIQRFDDYASSVAGEGTPDEQALMERMIADIREAETKAWQAEPKPSRRRADELADSIKDQQDRASYGAQVEIEGEAEAIDATTELRRELNELTVQSDKLDSESVRLQQVVNDAEIDHRQRAEEQIDNTQPETPSMVDDPIAAEQAEGMPAPQLSSEAPPRQLVDDHIFDNDVPLEDLDAEYGEVISQSRALLQQYGSYAAMPPDVQMATGKLANRAREIASIRNERTLGEVGTPPPPVVPDAAAMTLGETPGVTMDWWTVLSTGSPPAGVSTRLRGISGASPRARRDATIPRLRRTIMERGELRGRGGTPYRKSPVHQERILRGLHEPISAARDEYGRVIRRGRGTVIRPLTKVEKQARLRPRVTAAQQDLREMLGRARTSLAEKQAGLTEAEAKVAAAGEMRIEGLGGFADEAARRQAGAEAAKQAKLGASEARSQQIAEEIGEVQRSKTRALNDKTRVHDAYTRALDARNLHLADVRRRSVEAQIKFDAHHNYLKAMQGAFADPLKKGNPNLKQIHDDIRDLMSLRGLSTNDPEIRQIEALLAAASDAMLDIDSLQIHHDLIAKRLKDFDRAPVKNAMIPDVIDRVVADGWQPIAEDILKGPDALVIADSLKKAMDNIRRTIREPGFWKTVEKYTAFFSTYATAKPGFHVRNAMSGMFMNMVDGVRMREMRRAPSIWRDFRRNPEAFWTRPGAEAQKYRDALTVVFGSGAGGQFAERGLTEAATAGGKMYRVIMNNAFTRWNRRVGGNVEGTIRLAMALDSIERGLSLDAALDRVTKFHFDYTQLSQMDVTMRRLVPFWTFMSRNLPLQIEQMWMRPRTYLQYQSLVRNFGEELDPYTPDYWLGQGVFTVDENAPEREAPWYLAPDLPHLRVAEPFNALAEGNIGKAVLSDINPLFMAPLEAFAAGKKFYTGAELSEEYAAPTGGLESMMMPLFAMLGGTEQGGSGQQVLDERYAHTAASILPMLEFSNRLFGQEGTRAGRQGETIARALGAPVLKLTPEIQQSTYRSQRYERLQPHLTQAELARL